MRRTRWSYDAGADAYASWIRGELAAKPVDRAVLGGFAELVRTAGTGPVADVGCGTGRITAHLSGLGLEVFGVDLSPRMLAAARREHPGLRFSEGSMLGLDIGDAALGGLVAWYSVIHLPEEHRPVAFAEFARVLAPGGHLQLAFQVGDEVEHRTDVGGTPVSLDFHRLRPEGLTGLLERAGLDVRARLVREPDESGDYSEGTPQGFLLARKPLAPAQG
ncbi:class I SAM-dependent DNA methyltransferase [Salinifilum aidingensis]